MDYQLYRHLSDNCFPGAERVCIGFVGAAV